METKLFKVIYYKDAKKEWRWSIVASNGNIVADSSEGYVNKMDCIKELSKIRVWFWEVEQEKYT